MLLSDLAQPLLLCLGQVPDHNLVDNFCVQQGAPDCAAQQGRERQWEYEEGK